MPNCALMRTIKDKYKNYDVIDIKLGVKNKKGESFLTKNKIQFRHLNYLMKSPFKNSYPVGI